MQSVQAAEEDEPRGLERLIGQGSQRVLPGVGRRVYLPMGQGRQEEEEEAMMAE